MPIIVTPTYGSEPRVKAEPMPNARLTNAPGPDSFGAELGDTLARAGLSEADKAIQQHREAADAIALDDASAQLGTWVNSRLYDQQDGWLLKKGKDAMGLPEQAGDEFQKQADSIAQGLSNDRQRVAFARTAQERGLDLNGILQRHMASEAQQYDGQAVKAILDLSQADAVANATDPRRVGVELQRSVDTLTQYAQRNGIGPEQLQAQIQAQRTAIHTGVIDQLLAQNMDHAAQVYFEETKDQISGDSQAKIERALEEGNLRGESQRQADAIMSGQFAGSANNPDYGYGRRWDEATQSFSGPNKGLGYFGPLKNVSGQTQSEFSIDEEINGKNVSMPTLVPTLTKAQVQTLLSLKEGQPIPQDIVAKAVAYAKQRIAQGKSPFAGPGEQSNTYPELQRNPTPAAQTPQPPQSLSQALDLVRTIQDPKLRDQVQERVTREWTLKEEATRQAREDAMVQAGNLIDQHPGQGVRAVPPAVWSTFTPTEKSSLEIYAKRNLQPDGGEGKTDMNVWYSLRNLATDDPAKFAGTNLLTYLGKLSRSDFKSLADLQAGIRTKKPKDQDLDYMRTAREIVDDSLKAAGIATSGKDSDQTQVNIFRRKVDDGVLAFEQATGKKATKADVQAVADDQLQQVVTQHGAGWFYGLLPGNTVRDVSKRRFEITAADIPTKDKAQITQMLQATGQPVTDQAVVNWYLRLQREQENKR